MNDHASRAMPGPDAAPYRAPTSKSPAMRRLLAMFDPAPSAPPAGVEVSQARYARTREERIRRHEAVIVHALPKCDFCPAEANYDGRVKGVSAWASMCHVHFEVHGVGLGLGVGQELIRQVS